MKSVMITGVETGDRLLILWQAGPQVRDVWLMEPEAARRALAEARVA